VSPLYPQEPTSSVRPVTSEKCQTETSSRLAWLQFCRGDRVEWQSLPP